MFFLIFFTVYSLINFYFFFKIKSALNFSNLSQVGLLLFLIIMVFSPALVRFFEKQGFESIAIPLAWIGYFWMAFIVLFFFFGLIFEIIRAAFLVAKILPYSSAILRKFSFLLPFTVSGILVAYGYFEALDIKVEKVLIESDKVTENIKIVQISDLHMGLIVREGRVKKVIEIIKSLNPDIVVSTGDLVDGQIDKLDGIFNIFNEINPYYGKFAVTGNHEFYAGIDRAVSLTERAGFKLLRNNGVYIKNLNLSIVGIDDPEAKRYGYFLDISELKLLEKFKGSGFILYLKHRPIVNGNSIGLFDLQLSGHTHRGQFFPFSLITEAYYKKQSGFIAHGGKSYLYISRGTGTWGPPVRIFSTPEITLIEIIRKKS